MNLEACGTNATASYLNVTLFLRTFQVNQRFIVIVKLKISIKRGFALA